MTVPAVGRWVQSGRARISQPASQMVLVLASSRPAVCFRVMAATGAVSAATRQALMATASPNVWVLACRPVRTRAGRPALNWA